MWCGAPTFDADDAGTTLTVEVEVFSKMPFQVSRTRSPGMAIRTSTPGSAPSRRRSRRPEEARGGPRISPRCPADRPRVAAALAVRRSAAAVRRPDCPDDRIRPFPAAGRSPECACPRPSARHARGGQEVVDTASWTAWCASTRTRWARSFVRRPEGPYRPPSTMTIEIGARVEDVRGSGVRPAPVKHGRWLGQRVMVTCNGPCPTRRWLRPTGIADRFRGLRL